MIEIILLKFFAVFSIVFYGYVFYLGIQERRKFFGSSEYESASMFEKIVLNTVFFSGLAFFILMFLTYGIFIFSKITIAALF